MRVHWTVRAAERLEAIRAHIEQDSPDAALHLVQALLGRSQQLADFPRSGRRVPTYERDDVRELIEGDYRIIYRVMAHRVDVLAVMHGAQLLPVDLRKL